MRKLAFDGNSTISLKKCLNILTEKKYVGVKKYLLLLDIICSEYFIHSNLQEYLFYDFYKLSYKERKKFLLIYHQQNYFRKVNSAGFVKNKMEMYEKTKQFYGRETIQIPECGMAEFVEFVKKHKKVILKPLKGSYGKGIFVHEYTSDNDAISTFICLNNKSYACEEFIIQHQDMQKMNNSCVNTLRILTYYENGKANVVAAALRMGNGNSVVDNLRSGGIGANIDENTGIVDTVGMDYNGNVFEVHPTSGVSINGFKIPNWNKAIELVNNAAEVCKNCPILAWDIAITEDSAVLIEYNNRPGPMIHQFIDKRPKGEKILEFIKKNTKN